ncbi:MAG: shikimate kinase [Eubacteriales bacterium]
MRKQNVILIGMPGAGKSTVGVVLAKRLGFQFVDSDIRIQQEEDRLLHEIIAKEGTQGFLAIENRVNASFDCKCHVIATGGSAVYGEEAMNHLSEIGFIVYLKLPYEAIEMRLGDLNKRGVALKENQTLQDIYEERVPLYEKYANYIVESDELSIREVVMDISKYYRR